MYVPLQTLDLNHAGFKLTYKPVVIWLSAICLLLAGAVLRLIEAVVNELRELGYPLRLRI